MSISQSRVEPTPVRRTPVFRPGARPGFSLMELLVVAAILTFLMALLLPVLGRARESARSAQCLNQMRQISLAVRLYADANGDEFPRSQHSAFAHGQLCWGRAIALELGGRGVCWTNLLAGLYHCPSDRRETGWSYGQNVYFELRPESDDYRGSPATCRRLGVIPTPAATILDAESASGLGNNMGADHIMAHFWASPHDAAEVEKRRHRMRSNYSFVDGHVVSLRFCDTYAPEKEVDCWNPWLAR